ncbi:PorP/SprF family type IX secretion system membrane protein, partial [Tamlana sp. 2_MG-2023]|uniref:PorP/SprF family type IX secretion system membrane protein n=1 Tax=unclassified Tamlana TaxID=2614803 RepID=UPI0026E367A1
MKKYLFYILLFFSIIYQSSAQDDGVVALNIPVRNSLKFNRTFINPTFSFVREGHRYISFNNKRDWTQFENAPETYLFGYSGRFRESMGAGISLFQQNYGALTTFGGMANFAYNVVVNRSGNLTFGMNLGFYRSTINDGAIISNTPDPSLDNIPSNSIVTINPGINYGTEFFDFGVSLNNIVAYNLTSTSMIAENPEQGIQVHGMYTGYVSNYGYFRDSRFSTLIRSEFKKEELIFSGLMMFTVPKGFWGQAGYNSFYGISAGIGLNISPQIAIEYNFEKAVGNISALGNSHDITLAYRFKSKDNYDYFGDEDEDGLFISDSKNRNSRKVTQSATPKNLPRKSDALEKKRAAEAAAAAAFAKEKRASEAAALNGIAEADRLAEKAEADRIAEEARAKAAKQEALLAEERRVEEEKAALALAEEERLRKAEENRIAEEARRKAEQEAVALAEAERLRKEKEAEQEAQLAEERRLQEEQAALALAEEERLRKA